MCGIVDSTVLGSQEKGAEGLGLRLPRKKPPVSWGRAWPSSEPSAVAASALDPCRGWGRHPLARICAQKEPVVPPVGAGTEYRSTRRVSWGLVPVIETRHQGTLHRDTLQINLSVHSGRRMSQPSRRSSDMLGTGTRCRRRGRAGFLAGARCAHRPWSIRGGEGRRAIWGSAAACARGCAWRWPAGHSGRAGCLCNRDSGSRTRTGRSCRCAVVWHRHTVGRRAPRGV